MKKVIIILSIFLVAGCATKFPMTPEEAREAMQKGGIGMETKEFSVEGDYQKTVQRVKKLANSCLNKTTQYTSNAGELVITDYNPTVKIGKSQTEFYLQTKLSGNVLHVFDEPEDGPYMMIVDIFNRGGGKMDVHMIAPKWGSTWNGIKESTENWIRGTDNLCPSLVD